MKFSTFAALLVVPFGLPILAYLLIKGLWNYVTRQDDGDEVLAKRMRVEGLRAESLAEMPEPTGRAVKVRPAMDGPESQYKQVGRW